MVNKNAEDVRRCKASDKSKPHVYGMHCCTKSRMRSEGHEQADEGSYDTMAPNEQPLPLSSIKSCPPLPIVKPL